MKRLFKYIFRIILIALFTVFLCSSFVYLGMSQIQLGNERKLNENYPKTGIREEEYVTVNGREYYINVRGENKKKPVMIMVHGGPGVPMMSSIHMYQRELEKNFVVVNWDQYATGKSYEFADPNFQISIKQDISDLNGIINHIRKKLNVNKVIVTGFSWGTVLSMTYIQNYPEHVAAYIGVGQSVNYKRERLATLKHMEDVAVVLKSRRKISVIKRLTKKSKAGIPFNVKDVFDYKMLKRKLLRYEKRLSVNEHIRIALASPYYSLWDQRYSVMLNACNDKLRHYMKKEYDVEKMSKKFSMPIVFLSGNRDWDSPYILLQKYFQEIDAPYKKMRFLNGCGHSPFKEDPKQTVAALVTEANKALNAASRINRKTQY